MNGNYVEGGTININYNGRKLSETGTIGLASGSAKDKATVNYQPDIYIFDDNSGSWNFTTANNKMVYDNGVYTGTVTTTRKDACIMFGRKTGEDYDWNDYGNGGNRLFFGANSNGDWEYGTNTSGSLETNPSDNDHVKYSPIKFPEAGEYIITIDPKAEGGPTFSITSTSVNSIADGKAFQGNTFKFMGSAVATYQNGQRLWIRDASGSILVYGNVGETFENGDILAPGWTAGYELYIEYIPEFTNPQNVTKAQGTADAAALPLVDNKITTDDVNKYASLSNVTITGVSGNYFYYTVGDDSYQLRNYFSELNLDPLEVNRVYNVKGVVSYGNGNPQLWLTEVEDVTPERVKTPTFSPEAGTYYGAKTVSIACETEDATIYYTTNGTDPTTTSEVYRTPINVGQDMTIKAIAVKEGMLNSTIAEAVYTIKDPSDLTQYTKVTNTTDLTNGNYLIVYEDGNLAFDGSLETLDAANNTFDVDISEGVIYTDVDGFFTYDANAGTLKSASGYYIGQISDANGLKSSEDEAYVNAVSIVNAEAVITSGGAYLRYNKTSGQDRFRYFKSSTYTAQQPIQLYKEVKATLPLAVTLPDAPAEPYKVGKVVKVKATVENGSENTKLTYKVGDETLTIGEDGNVTLPNKKAGDVVLTVTAKDGDKQATDTKTYVFDAADALAITLTPATGTYTVGDVQNVTVTVEGAIATNPTITYKFGEEEAQTYNAETGIVLPTAQAGTINLTVMVDDGGYEHDGATTATGTYTVNHKALTITLDPETKTFTVGDVAKVIVTIENAVGTPTVTCKVGDETLDLVDGYVTLPDTKKAGEEVTLTVTARDEREGAQDVVKTGTYTFTAAPAITFGMDVVHEPEGDTYHVGDVVKVKVANVENNIGNVTVTYKIGDTELVPDENGYVTIPTNEVTDVTLTVTVKDAYEHDTEATQNFVFNIAAAPAITFTLTPDGGEYTVGDKVNVKVSNFQNTIGDYTITYTTNFTREAQTYDPAKGIDITSDEAGQVNLTVTVTDAYEHAAEGTKSAVYKFAAAPAIEITLNPDGGEYIVGDVVNVTVAVAKTLGDYTVVYQIDGGEVQNYDAATGIVITRSTVGNVDLKVTVTDGYEHEGDGTASATYVFKPVPVVAAPTFSLASGTYDTPQDVTITGPEGATIYYSVDGGLTWTEGNSRNMTETTILMAKAVKDGIESPVVTNAYVIKQTVERIPVEPIDGYFSIKNNGNNMFANVQGRKTLTFCDDAAKEAQAGTVIYVKTNEYGQVQSLRSQGADLQGYADRAMRYVPSIVEMIVNKLHATGAGEVLGETGYEAIMEKFNESFDHHLYVEKNDELGYRIYGKTPSMQPVVDFYAENKSKVDAKLPMLEGFINDAIDKVLNKTGGHGASILQHFSVHETWQRMGGTLTEPVDSASTMAFYQQVLCNKDNVWSFAYETAMTYWERVKAHEDQYESLKEKLGEFAQYIDEIEQINPDFKYYIVQNNDKPDFISEGNGDIINGAARTYWTLVPRTTFKVNFPEANAFGGDDDTKYAVTLYTDFAYTVPEGVVTANKVTEVAEDGLATYEAISGVIPAQTPVMLISQSAGEKELTLSTASAAAVTENLLKGPDYLVDNYDLVTPQVQALFEFAKSVLGDDLYNNYLKEYEHLMMLNSGTVNNKYFWGLNEDDTWTCLEKNADGVLDCVVRSLGVDQNGNFAFNTKEVRTNEAFLVDATLDAIKLYQEEIATPEFSLVPGSYTGNQTLEITCDTEGAEISYSLDGGDSWTNASEVTLTKDCTVMAKATKDGVESAVATAQYIIDQPTVITPIEPIDGYFKIMNNGNNKYANVQGRKTLTFTDAPDDQAGTVIYVKTNDKGQVQSLRSQAADLQGYADRAMNYVPQFVNLVVDKLNADGEGNLLGENGLGEIMEKFDSCFDHHLYVEEAEGGYRIYGKTPNMQDVVDFYRAHTEQVETKLPMLEDFINTALTKLRDKIGGSSIFTPFSLHQIWQNMGGTLTEPTNEASTMAFYREVLNNKNYVWDFAYQTAMIYWTNVKSHPQYEEKLKPMLGEYADYIERIEDIHPDFKYYIVQNNDKPDFISEGNGDIINNAARTIWTLTPRDEFTVNIPEENMFGCPLHPMYGKTLYTDFAYTLSEGVKAYAVDSISPRGTIQTVEITGIIPAQTPVLLKAETFGDKVITISTTDGAAVAENLLKGPDYLIDEYKIVTPQVADMFSMAKDILGDDFYDSCLKDYEYLMYRNSGTVNNKYFWGLNEDDTWTCLEENADGVLDCVVRSLGIDDNGIFAFNKKEVRVNEAFMVTTAFDALNLYQKGDVNHDGSIDIDDITATIGRVLGMAPEGYFCTVCADVFEDNIIDIDDVTALIDIVLGK